VAAFAAADHVFEHTFRTQQVLHVPLEPFVSIGEVTDTGLTIHTASQSPSFVRIEIARLLGWPENKVRVKVPYLGGGFGAKLYIKLEALVAALALIVRRINVLVVAVQFLVLPMTFTSSAYMQLNLAPEWIQAVSTFNPLNWAVVAARDALQANTNWSEVGANLGLQAMTWADGRERRTGRKSRVASAVDAMMGR